MRLCIDSSIIHTCGPFRIVGGGGGIEGIPADIGQKVGYIADARISQDRHTETKAAVRHALNFG